MNEQMQLSTAAHSMGRFINWLPAWKGFFLFVCLGFCLSVQAQTDANGNTKSGTGALSHLAGGTYNTAFGLQALFSNTVGNYNSGTGINALYANTNGNYNTANGLNALHSNTSGYQHHR